jgi:arylsulfatase A-like enzyme
MTDQHRADCLGCAGNRIIKTPNLDSIAADGALFSNAYTSTPSCTPARSAILTGLSPWHHGMLGYGRIAGQYPFELPQALRDAGYYLFGIGKMHWYPQKKLRGYHGLLVDESGRVETPGFVSDYRLWFKQQAPDLDPDATGIGWNDYRAKAYALPERVHPTAWTADRAVEFIDKYDRPEPFMLKVSFARPHSPYDPPQRFMDMYNVDDMPAPVVGDWAARYASHGEPPDPSL